MKFLTFLALLFIFGPLGNAQAKPNVLFLAIDDLNDWIGCLGGHPQVKTPNLDKLAARGTLFTNAHCQAPVCNPSRTSVLLGLRPSTTGIYSLQPSFKRFRSMPIRLQFPRYSVSMVTILRLWERSITELRPKENLTRWVPKHHYPTDFPTKNW